MNIGHVSLQKIPPSGANYDHVAAKDFESYSVDTLDDLRTWLFLAQFREEVENVTEGWTFPPHAQDHLGPTGKEDTELRKREFVLRHFLLCPFLQM